MKAAATVHVVWSVGSYSDTTILKIEDFLEGAELIGQVRLALRKLAVEEGKLSEGAISALKSVEKTYEINIHAIVIGSITLN